MKKFLAIILGAIFVLSFAASAFAIHAEIPAETQAVVAKGATQISIDGELRTRGWYIHNIVDTTGAKAINGLPGDGGSSAWYDQRVRLSVDAKVTPNVEGFIQLESGNEINGTAAASGDRYIWGNFDSKPADIKILQDWILYSGQGLLGFPAGLKIGHMPLALGEWQFFENTKFGDDAIVFFMDPTKELHVGLLTIKFLEGTRQSNTDDLDGYVGLAVFKWDPKNTVGIHYTYLNLSAAGLKESNLGLHANGNISGLTYKAEADFQFGDKSTGKKAKGYGLMAGLGYSIDPVGIRASAAYGTGDSDGTGEKKFDTFLSNQQHYTLIYEYNVTSAAGGISTGISNTTYLNLGVDFAPMKDLKASLDGYLLRATKSNTAVAGSDSKSIGWEADAKVVYALARNLNYQVDAGYLKAGSFYGDDKKNATVLRHMITLSF
ncbi:MAG: alginate export family protein [Thermodesulfovibrionales bacterium]